MGARYVRSDQVRMLLKLVGEARELRDTGAARAHVLEGLSRLVGAPIGVALTSDRLSWGVPIRVRDYLDHGWTDREAQRVLAFYETTPIGRDPLIGGILSSRGTPVHVTLRRADLVTDDAWYRSELHNELHRPERLDDVLVSMRFDDGAAPNTLVFKRAAGDRAFSPEEREILDLYRAESDWVFRPVSRLPRRLTEGLTHREQDTLELLLTDASEKMVAARLGISPHTVHDHVKKLYKKLGVSSRAALMALVHQESTSLHS